MPHNLFDDLNESQREAVTYCDGPSLVIAGAGSGKTRVLTYKIAYLLQNGLAPWNILALTFTNKAAREMNGRIAELTGPECARRLWSGTFHSILSRILRAECDYIGFRHDFTIYDAADSRSLIKAIVKEMQLDDKAYKPAAIACRISEAKNHLILPSDYAADGSIIKRDAAANMKETHAVYSEYVRRCRQSNAMDFDDLLLNAYVLFRDHPDVCRKYAERFQYILVDEYQDTNLAQHRIISQLTRPDSRICVVGDDAQSIYGFRGANIDNILRFNIQYPAARTIKLECNYRSTQNIVNAANSIIRHNKNQIAKTVYTNNERGERIRVLSAYSDKEESYKVAGEISRLHRRQGISYEDIAVLYRTNAQSRSFEDTLREAAVPYRIYGGLSFYQRKEIKDVIAYFRMATNPNDEEAFKRIINYPARGIGEKTVLKLQLAASEHAMSLWDVLGHLAELVPEANKGTVSKLEKFRLLIEELRADAEQLNAHEAATAIIKKSGICNAVAADRDAESLSRRENIDELLNAIQSFESEQLEENGEEHVHIGQYLSQVSLFTDADKEDDDTPKVTLMTVHAAKGLEFEAVFVTGMEEGLFPNDNSRYSPREKEEERRLFYVAVTRAKKYCTLSYAKSRFRYGQVAFSEPSSFIDEIDEQCLERESPSRTSGGWQPRPASPLRGAFFDEPPTSRFRHIEAPLPDAGSRTAASASAQGFSVGMAVKHERFGSGKVLSIEGAGDSTKIRVEFENAGTKNLLLKYAKLTKLS